MDAIDKIDGVMSMRNYIWPSTPLYADIIMSLDDCPLRGGTIWSLTFLLGSRVGTGLASLAGLYRVTGKCQIRHVV